MSSTPLQKPLKILAVDDEIAGLQLLQTFLGTLGHEVIQAKNGMEAIFLYEATRPDIVLMDIRLPDIDGYEATRRMRASPLDHWAPVVFLSAMLEDDALVQALDAGGDDFLSKPIHYSHLEAKLRALQRTLDLQKKLRESHSYMASVSENLVDGLVTIDEQGTILWASQVTCAMFGYPLSGLTGRNVKMLMPEPYASQHDRFLERYVEGGRPRIIGVGQREVQGLRHDRSIFHMELGVSEMWVEGRRNFVGIVRDISARKQIEHQLQEKQAELQRYFEEQEQENQLAQDIVSHMLRNDGLEDEALTHWVRPARHFSGDVVAGARDASGRLYVMLADATGHGLGAAISAMPVVTEFYHLAALGAAVPDMARHINQRLAELLPRGRFVAAAILRIDPVQQKAEIWQGGIPCILWLDATGELREKIAARHLPLGILPTLGEDCHATELRWQDGDQFLLASDGLFEAEGPDNHPFGIESLMTAVRHTPAHQRMGAIRSRLDLHLAGREPLDDISIMLVNCCSSRQKNTD